MTREEQEAILIKMTNIAVSLNEIACVLLRFEEMVKAEAERQKNVSR